MGTRLELQELLEDLLGSNHVYFQPPPNVQMEYPAIVYKKDDVDTRFADNQPYRHVKQYSVAVIDSDPDSIIPDKIGDLPMSRFSRQYVANNLYHNVYALYF